MKLKKESIFVKVGETKYIHQPAKEKKGVKVGEVTVGIATIAIPIKNFAPTLSKQMFKVMEKVAAGFPDVTLKFNFRQDAEAYIATITAKTECREDDTYSEEIGKKIVNSKIQAIALRVARRMATAFWKNYEEWASQMQVMVDFFDNQIVKEKDYISKALYLPKQAQE